MIKSLKLFLSFLLITGFISMPQVVMADRGQLPPPHWHSLFMIVYSPVTEYTPLMRDAFGEWQSKLGKEVEFYHTDNTGDQNAATIDISYNRIVGEDAKNSVVATCNKNEMIIKDAKIVVNAKYDPKFEEDANAREENEKELYAMMVHAVGVALGVPVSSDENSVMYSAVKENQTITEEDAKNVLKVFIFPKLKDVDLRK